MSLLVYHFTIFTNFSAHAGLYRQLVRRPMILLILPFFCFRIYQFYTVNRITYRLYHFTTRTNLAPSEGLCRQLAHCGWIRQSISQSES